MERRRRRWTFIFGVFVKKRRSALSVARLPATNETRSERWDRGPYARPDDRFGKAGAVVISDPRAAKDDAGAAVPHRATRKRDTGHGEDGSSALFT